jgi:hypothetical protein
LGEITNSNLTGRQSEKVRALIVNLKLELTEFGVEETSKLDSADLDDE